ncbi:MAG: hypothetical protein ABW252_07235 [Polyangiales bacterium]
MKTPAKVDASAPAVVDPTAATPVETAVAPTPSRAASPLRARRSPAVAVPVDGCATQASHLLTIAARDGLAGHLEGPIALAFERDAMSVALWTLDDPPVRRWERPLPAAIARAVLLCTSRCTLGLVDTRAVLSVIGFDRARADAPRVLARGVDRRFAPALAPLGRDVLVAYTATRDETMHSWLTRASGAGSPRDLTPPAHGAASPTFVLGAPTPTLVMIDARAGMSPLLEVALDARGTPGEVSVRTPVSQPTAPPVVLATTLRGGEVEVFFTLIGRIAMTAVGRVSLRRAEAARPLLASTGYGALRMAAATSGLRTLVALEVPTAPAPDAPRQLLLKLLDGLRTDDVLVLQGERPSLAASAPDGSYVLTWSGADGLQADLLACDPR